jgi:hypothetical protein
VVLEHSGLEHHGGTAATARTDLRLADRLAPVPGRGRGIPTSVS